MHEVLASYISWSATLFTWARAVVGIVLWFWVISGVIFALRFLAFFLLDRNTDSSRLASASPSSFPMESLENVSEQETIRQ